MVTFYEHEDTSLAYEGKKVTLAELQDDPVVLLSSMGDILLAHKTRIIEMDSWDLDPEEAYDLDDLDRRESEINNLIAWLDTLPDSEDRNYLRDDLKSLLDEVPYAREMIELENQEAAHTAEAEEEREVAEVV
jgi:hypothetical protein